MPQSVILALDQGTTSTRAIVFDQAGMALAEASRPLRQSYPQDGWVEHDAEEIWTACTAVLREAFEGSGRILADVAALGITNQRETVVIWDRATGRPIHPAIVWQDRRTADFCRKLKPKEKIIRNKTGLCSPERNLGTVPARGSYPTPGFFWGVPLASSLRLYDFLA
jgi:glycerol kinase